MGKLSVREYWGRIIRDSRSAATDGQAFRARVSEVGLRIVAVVLVALIAISFAAGTFLNSAFIGIITFVGLPLVALILGLVGSFFRNLIYQPAAMDAEKSNEIKRLKDKYEANGIPSPPIITAYEDEQTHRDVGVSIENPNDSDLEHPSIRLVKLIYVKPNGVRETVPVSQTNREFNVGAYLRKNDCIPAHQKETFPLARAGDHMVEFGLRQGFERRYSFNPDTGEAYATGESGYEIEFSVSGEVSNRRVEVAPPIKLAAHFKNDDRTNIRSASAKLVEHEQEKTDSKANSTKT